jgi:8-oxo-dGTP pyrophosphatase MutT (NUDIX family)
MRNGSTDEVEMRDSMGYIMDLRKLVGSRPLIMAGASVILMNDRDEILLQQRTDNGFWGTPGGAMEPGESLEETARREVLEETGLRAEELELFDVFSGKELYYKYPHGDEVYNVVTVYTCRKYSGELTAEPSEVERLRFFPLSEIPTELSPPDVPVLRKYKAVGE